MLNFLIKNSINILNTVLTAKELYTAANTLKKANLKQNSIKPVSVLPNPPSTPLKAKREPMNSLPEMATKTPNKTWAKNFENSGAIAFFTTAITVIPPQCFSYIIDILFKLLAVILQILYTGICVAFHAFCNIIKFGTMVTYLLFAISLGAFLYWLSTQHIELAIVKTLLMVYSPELINATIIHQISLLILGLFCIFILWFFYLIMFTKQPTKNLILIQKNGYKELLISSLPPENTLWGKAFIALFLSGCATLMFCLIVFFQKTLPDLVKQYGSYKSEILNITKPVTLEDKAEWIKEIKIVLVDMEVPTKIITPILKELVKILPNVTTQQDLLSIAVIKVQFAFNKLNADLKFTLWENVILQHPWTCCLTAIFVIGSIITACWIYSKDIQNLRTLMITQAALHEATTKEIVQRLEYLASCAAIIEDAIAKGQASLLNLTSFIVEYQTNVEKMLHIDFTSILQPKIDAFTAAAKAYGASTTLAHNAIYHISTLQSALQQSPNEVLKRLCTAMNPGGIAHKPTSVITELASATYDFFNFSSKIKLAQAHKVVKKFHEHVIEQANPNHKENSISTFEWLTHWFN